MVYTVSGYSQEQLVKWKLKAGDALIIKWFVTFMQSGKMATVEHCGQTYYWVRYQAVINDLPILGIGTSKGIASRFRRIVKAGLLDFFLKKNEEGTYSTYRLNSDQYKKLLYHSTMETKKVTGETAKVSPIEPKRKPKDYNTNKTIIQNDDEASITLEHDSYNTMKTFEHNETKEMNQEGFVPPDSPDAKYQAAISTLVAAYNKAALKARYMNASPANVATFFNSVTLNLEMLPLLVKHMDEWFRWTGRNGDAEKLGDRSISMLAYNLRPFYEHVAAIPTEEQIIERKKRDLAPEITGWDVD